MHPCLLWRQCPSVDTDDFLVDVSKEEAGERFLFGSEPNVLEQPMNRLVQHPTSAGRGGGGRACGTQRTWSTCETNDKEDFSFYCPCRPRWMLNKYC